LCTKQTHTAGLCVQTSVLTWNCMCKNQGWTRVLSIEQRLSRFYTRMYTPWLNNG